MSPPMSTDRSPPPPENARASPDSPATRRPQLTAEELQQLRWLLGNGLTLLGVGTVFYMDVEAWTLMVLTAAAAIAVLVRPTLPARVPGLVHTLAFPAILAFCAGDLWLRGEVLPAMVRLDMLLLLYRTITYRQRRDDLQVIVLGLFLIVIAGVLTVSLTFALQILFYTGCALAFLLVITLSESPGVKNVAPERGAPPPAWAVHADWGQLFRRIRVVTNWRVIGFGTALFVGVVAVSALLFLAIPRFQFETNMLLDRFISKKAKSGFSDRIRFGDVTEIVQDNSIALSVDVSDQSRIPATPYWRMLVLDQYQEGMFRLSPQLRRERFERERPASFVVGRALSARGAPVMWTFYLEPGISRFLPLIGHYERISFREMQNFSTAPTLALLELRGEPVTMTAYRAEDFDLSGMVADPDFGQRWSARETSRVSAVLLQTELRLEETDVATVRRVATQILGEETLPAAQAAQRINEWLRRNHDYSLSPRIPAGTGDPLVRWMNSREAGHCELFAGSFVLLARAAGYPARVVTGFKGGTWNAYSNNFTIRNSDAHAWGEIFDPTAGTQGAWRRADPLGVSAGAQADQVRGAEAINARLDRSWTARLDSLRVFWYRRIVSFDQRSQVETLRAVKEATQNAGKRFRQALENSLTRIRGWMAAPWDARRVLKALGSLAILGLFAWWWVAFGREWWRIVARPRGRTNEDPVRRQASYWLRQVSSARESLAGGGAPAGALAPPTADAITSVLPDLQRLRYGRRDTWPAPPTVFRRARQAVRAARRRRALSRSSI